MKKIFLTLAILLCTQSFAEQKDRYGIAAFAGLGDDGRTFVFTFRKAQKDRFFPCDLKNLNIIAAGASRCITDAKELRKFDKEYKKALESVIKPGKRYYVNLINRGNDAYICDVSDPKSNLRLDLVAAGFAVPITDDSELLLKAAEEAKEAKRGMYSAKFWDITNCILNGVPIPKKDEDK